jgi:hypothetical protein
VYNKFTLAEKAKLWQLKNPGKTPGSGPAGKKTGKSAATVAEFASAISSAVLAISELTATTAKQSVSEEGGNNEDELMTDENSGNPVLAHQEHVPKKAKN